MGCLRTLLAFSVVLSHMGLGKYLVGGVTAVQIFYIISGFYMAMILNSGYGKVSYFYINRFFRLFPIYWVVALISFISWIALGENYWGRSFEDYLELPLGSQLVLTVTNIFLVGQDWIMFLEPSRGWLGLTLTADFSVSETPMYQYLLSAPAWTLGVELAFYLFAPFLVRRHTLVIVALICVSILLRLAAAGSGLNHDPWTYRFFPFELALFLWGVVAFRAQQFATQCLESHARTIPLLTCVFYFGAVLFLDLVFERNAMSMIFVYYIPLILVIPFLFSLTKDSRIDNLIGELSYT